MCVRGGGLYPLAGWLLSDSSNVYGVTASLVSPFDHHEILKRHDGDAIIHTVLQDTPYYIRSKYAYNIASILHIF